MAGGLVSVFRRSVDGADNEKMLKTICVYIYIGGLICKSLKLEGPICELTLELGLIRVAVMGRSFGL